MAMDIENTMTIAMEIATATETEMAIKMTIETTITTLPMVFVYKQDSVRIPQIQMGLHNAGHVVLPAMTCTLVVYLATL